MIEVVKCRVQARTETGGTGPDELLFLTRDRQADNTYKLDYYLSNGDSGTPLKELARVAKAEHRIEECLKLAKGEAGLGDYQVRTWRSWQHHQTLSLLAAWYLNQETRRGKNRDPRTNVPAIAGLLAGLIDYHLSTNHPEDLRRLAIRWLRRNEIARLNHHRMRNVLPPLRNQLRT